MPPSEDHDIEENTIESIDGSNIIFHCILHDDQSLLAKVFEDSTNKYYEQCSEFLNSTNAEGKLPIELACVLGRTAILQDLIKRGVDVTASNSSGYSPFHYAACWGHKDCLKTLVQNGAKVDLRTKYGETPRQLAVRYKHSDCIEYIDWAAAKYTLTSFIAYVKELVADIEKLQGVKLTKDEKSTALGSCNEKTEWIENTPEATVEDFLLKKGELEKQVEVILNKANSPAPPTGSSGKK